MQYMSTASGLGGNNLPEQAPILPGFDHVRRYWDRDNQCWVAKVLPGEYYVTCANEGIGTVLGSCVSACIRDPRRGVGGINHFMLPEDSSNGRSSWLQPEVGLSTRYGSFAMEQLINDLLKLGARRERLEIKLFGGGKILASMTDVGARNIAFIRNFVRVEGYRIAAENLGDVYPRRILYFPISGRVLLKRLRAVDSESIAVQERQYLGRIDTAPAADDIELFD
jgi:chemotaxis protein CheD